MDMEPRKWLIEPHWVDNRNDIFPGEFLIKMLLAVDLQGVFHILDVVKEKK